MSTAPIVKPLPPGSLVFGLCRALVTREESYLQTMLSALRQVRQMLGSSAPEALGDAVRQAVEAAGLVAKLRDQRDRFRQVTAKVLQVPVADVTLRLVAEHLPPGEAEVILAGRQRLFELAGAVEQVNHGNALVAWWCLDFIHQVFAQIQGHPVRARYSSKGKVHKAICGPTWQGQG
jgi:hypothetical protein